MVLSFGVKSYFKLIKDLIVLLLELTVLSIPLYALYGAGNGLEDAGLYSGYTMGNMGAAGTICFKD